MLKAECGRRVGDRFLVGGVKETNPVNTTTRLCNKDYCRVEMSNCHRLGLGVLGQAIRSVEGRMNGGHVGYKKAPSTASRQSSWRDFEPEAPPRLSSSSFGSFYLKGYETSKTC